MKKAQKEGLEFKSDGTSLSLGVEIELQVLDSKSLLLTPRAREILERAQDDKLDHEFFQSTIEVKTGICTSAYQAASDLRDSITKVSAVAKELNLSLGSTGTHPLADYRERLITPSPRYEQLTDRNQWIIRRMAVYGMHVHVGMRDGDTCIRNNYFFMHMVPHIMALSASSPFWQGKDTGLSACRPTTYEALPTAGMPYMVKDWEGFQKLYRFLVKSRSIESMKDLWWDLRPSPHYGTLELRFCDQPATLFEIEAIVAFIHLLAHWFMDHESEWTTSHAPLKQWIIRENKWRTLRYGLDADIVITKTGKTKSLRKDILDWTDLLATYATQLNYKDQISMIREIVLKGNSSQRQQRVFRNTNDLDAIIRHNVREFENGHPDWLA